MFRPSKWNQRGGDVVLFVAASKSRVATSNSATWSSWRSRECTIVRDPVALLAKMYFHTQQRRKHGAVLVD